MSKNVLDYEPQNAIFVPQGEPLIFYKAINNFLLSNLKKGGLCYLEINPLLADKTTNIFTDFKVQTLKDLSQKDRFIKIEN